MWLPSHQACSDCARHGTRLIRELSRLVFVAGLQASLLGSLRLSYARSAKVQASYQRACQQLGIVPLISRSCEQEKSLAAGAGESTGRIYVSRLLRVLGSKKLRAWQE